MHDQSGFPGSQNKGPVDAVGVLQSLVLATIYKSFFLNSCYVGNIAIPERLDILLLFKGNPVVSEILALGFR